MKKLLVSSALVALTALSGCSISRTPLVNTTDIRNVDFSKVDQMKKGSDCSTTFLFILGPFGEQKITKAAKDAKISKVEVVDYDVTNYILFQRMCVEVYGN